MRALWIILSIIGLITILIFGIRQLKRREKESDKSVADVAEDETTKSTVTKAAGIKPIDINKALSDLKSKTKAMQSLPLIPLMSDYTH